MNRADIDALNQAIYIISNDILVNCQALGSLPDFVTADITNGIEEYIKTQLYERDRISKLISKHNDSVLKKISSK